MEKTHRRANFRFKRCSLNFRMREMGRKHEHVLRGGWKGLGKSHQPASEWGVGISRQRGEGCPGSCPLSRWPDSAFLKQSVVVLRKTVKGLEGLSKVKSSKPAFSGKLHLGPLKKNDPPNQCYNEYYGKQERDQQSPSHWTGSALRPSWDPDNPLPTCYLLVTQCLPALELRGQSSCLPPQGQTGHSTEAVLKTYSLNEWENSSHKEKDSPLTMWKHGGKSH